MKIRLLFYFVPFAAICLLALHFVLIYVDGAERIEIRDPVLQVLPVADVSLFIFPLTYLPVLIFLFSHLKDNKAILFVQVYVLLIGMRSLTIFLLPLEAPDRAVVLNDPILNTFFYPGGYSPYDLFFSGHVSALFSMYFIENKYSAKLFYLISGLILGLLLMIQHVHYFIDIAAAPVFAIIAVKIINRVNDRLLQ